MRLLRLVCSDPKVDLTLEMGDGPATPTAGTSAWEVIDRVEEKGIVDRASVAPFAQSVPVFLDGLSTRQSMQGPLDKILSLGGADPAVFRAFGPIHRSGIRYVLGGELEYGEVVRDDDGTLIRQRLTLPLMEYVPPEPIRRRRRRRGTPGLVTVLPNSSSFYITKQGDSVAKIAAKVYGDWKRWPEIGRKNGINDPHRRFDVGRKIKL